MRKRVLICDGCGKGITRVDLDEPDDPGDLPPGWIGLYITTDFHRIEDWPGEFHFCPDCRDSVNAKLREIAAHRMAQIG